MLINQSAHSIVTGVVKALRIEVGDMDTTHMKGDGENETHLELETQSGETITIYVERWSDSQRFVTDLEVKIESGNQRACWRFDSLYEGESVNATELAEEHKTYYPIKRRHINAE